MFIAMYMKPMADIDWLKGFETEAEADAFGIEWSSYSELSPEDKPDHWEKYDPAVVLVFEAESWERTEVGKYIRPVSLYQRGQKWRCVLDSDDPPIPPR